jgi:energy-coupling factor transport system permease protein
MGKVNVTNFLSNVGGDSWIHRLDPRTKLAILFFFSLIPLLFTDFRFIAIFIVLSLPLWLTSKINFRPMVGPFVAAGFFMLIIFLLNAVRGANVLTSLDPNEAFTWHFRLGPIVLTSHSVTRGLFVAIRLAVPLTIGMLIIATTDPCTIGKGLRKLKVPTPVVFMLLAGLRFIPIIMEQLFNILDALTIRGVSSSRIERTKLMILPLFITSLRRTRTMGLACEARGFGANKWDSYYQEFRLGISDKVMMAAVAVLAVAFVYLRYGLGVGVAGVGFIR